MIFDDLIDDDLFPVALEGHTLATICDGSGIKRLYLLLISKKFRDAFLSERVSLNLYSSMKYFLFILFLLLYEGERPHLYFSSHYITSTACFVAHCPFGGP